MYGRYGSDELYMFMAVISMALLIVDVVLLIVVQNPLAKGISTGVVLASMVGLTVYSTWRSMSKNIYKRRRENDRFLKLSRAIRRFFTFNTSRKSKSGNADTDQYIFRDCTKCSCTLRLPRKKGRHKVKCPRCGHRFKVISK